MPMKAAVLFIGFWSIFSLTVLVLSIQNNERLKSHPSRLIQLICMIEGIFCWISIIQSPFVGPGYWTCYFYSD